MLLQNPFLTQLPQLNIGRIETVLDTHDIAVSVVVLTWISS